MSTLPTFQKGDRVYAGNTLAEFVRYLGETKASAIILVGLDSRVVNSVILRSAK